MKNLDILAIVSAYTAKKEKGDGIKLPAAVAWKRRLNFDKLFKAKGIIDEALREVGQRFSDDEHSEATEDGGRKVKPEYMQEFVTAQGEILTQDTPVDIQKVSIDAIGDVELTDADMDTLAFMIEGGD